MAMDLDGAGGMRSFSFTTWRKMLELAYVYGWKPAGTEPGKWVDSSTGELDEQMSPDPETWDSMDYFSNGFQWVTDEDAARIADALEQALDDTPDLVTDDKRVEFGPPNLPPRLAELSPADQESLLSVLNRPFSSLEYFSGEGKQEVRDFVAFCRAGAFFLS